MVDSFQGGLELADEPPDGVLVAAVVRPLADPLRGHQPGAGEQGEVRGDGGLREPTLLLNEAHAHAILVQIPDFLAAEVLLGILEPPEDLEARLVVQRLEDGDVVSGGHRAEYIDNSRYVNLSRGRARVQESSSGG